MSKSGFNVSAANSLEPVQYVVQVRVDEPKTRDTIRQKVDGLEAALKSLGNGVDIRFRQEGAQAIVIQTDPSRLADIRQIPDVVSVVEDKPYDLECAAPVSKNRPA